MFGKRPLIGCTTYRKSFAPGRVIEGLMPTYTNAILAAGGIPVMIPLVVSGDALVELLAGLDGVLLPGGGDIDPVRYGGNGENAAVYGVDPLRDELELAVARCAIDKDIPLLAICRGHQILNVSLGGSLWEDVFELMPNAHRHAYFAGFERDRISHEVRVCRDSVLYGLLGSEQKPVNSLHHQGIKRLGNYLSPVAYAPDGLIEAVELRDHRFAVGVQWHPEEFYSVDSGTLALFEGFVAACR